jgi:hypothetical protein
MELIQMDNLSSSNTISNNILGIVVSTLLLFLVVQFGNNLPNFLSNEYGASIALTLIFVVGGLVGYFYPKKYTFIIVISGSLVFISVIVDIFSNLNDHNLWPIELFIYLFIISLPYYFGAYLSNNFFNKNKKESK